MSLLPIARVETPGCQENFTFLEDQSLLPAVGDVKLTSLGSDPPGWRAANGGELSREGFRELFTVLGTSYGPGDGTTTFNLPDMAGTEPLAGQTYIVRVK